MQRPDWLGPSVVVLFGVNLVPLWGVLALDWAVFDVMALFWAENVALGAINVLRMTATGLAATGLEMAQILLVPFFAFHYGFFCVAHGVFVFALFGGDFTPPGFDAERPSEVLALLRERGLAVPLALLAASHLFSFFWNFLGRGEFHHTNMQQLMVRPYGRIVVLHVALILGAFAIAAMDSPAGGLALLVAFKIALDLRAHRTEHREKLPADIAGEPTLREIMARLERDKAAER